MTLTKEQKDLKQAIINHLLDDKRAAYNQAVIAQQADMDEAAHTNDNQDDPYESGKADQAINRVRAKTAVSDKLEEDIRMLEGVMDYIEPTEELQIGDLIRTDKGNFFVCVVSDKFELNGESYMGITINSPLYKAAIGANSGDTVTVNGNDYKVKEIF